MKVKITNIYSKTDYSDEIEFTGQRVAIDEKEVYSLLEGEPEDMFFGRHLHTINELVIKLTENNKNIKIEFDEEKYI